MLKKKYTGFLHKKHSTYSDIKVGQGGEEHCLLQKQAMLKTSGSRRAKTIQLHFENSRKSPSGERVCVYFNNITSILSGKQPVGLNI